MDFAQTFLDFAGIEAPDDMQGASLRPILKGETPEDWQTSMYYCYWEHMDPEHNVAAHYGIRTHHYKLICYYGEGFGLPGTSDIKKEPEWELFDLQEDPYEINNVYNDPNYQDTVEELKQELYALKEKVKDVD